MNVIDKGYDPLLKANYSLASISFNDLKDLAKSWYKDIDLSKFDQRHLREDYEYKFKVMKRAGLMSNFFYAYLEDGKYYLMDGFNRLFTDYGSLDHNPTVYLKIITDKLEDHQLMSIMFQLNLWKLFSTNSVTKFDVYDFLDRGFRLFLNSKFGIEFYYHKDYHARTRNIDDIRVIDYYFVREHDFCGYFKLKYDLIFILMNNVQTINDFKEIIKANDYLTEPFKNYDMFLNGYAMYISEQRVKGDINKYEFDTFLKKLQEDKKFFKKLQGMSRTDSTRKNIYHFFRETF
jgi:hypothetical protein